MQDQLKYREIRASDDPALLPKNRWSLVLSLAVSIFAMVALMPPVSSADPQGPWVLPATDLSLSSQEVLSPQISTGSDGTTAAIWSRSNGTNVIVQATVRPPGGEFGPTQDLSAPGQAVPDANLAVGPDGTVTAVWNRNDGSNEVIQSRTRPPGGVFGPIQNLSSAGVNAVFPKVAIGPDGTTVATWTQGNGLTVSTVHSTIRPPGGIFEAPQQRSPSARLAFTSEVAFGPDGTATIVWFSIDPLSNPNDFEFIVQGGKKPAGGSFGPTKLFSEPGQKAALPQIGFGPDSTATVAWFKPAGADLVVQTTTQSADGSSGPVEDLGLTSQGPPNPKFELAIGSDGTTAIAWAAPNGSNQVVRARIRNPGDSFGEVIDLSPSSQEAAQIDIALAPDGTVTAVWLAFDGSKITAQSRTRPPAGSFGPVVNLSTDGLDAEETRVAIRSDGVATALWLEEEDSNDIVRTASTATPEPTLEVLRQGAGQGRVTSNPSGIDCGSDCSGDYSVYEEVTLTATAEPGSRFTVWSGDCSGESLNCSLRFDGSKTAIANFEISPTQTCPAKRLKPGKLKLNRSNGSANLAVKAGGKGRVILKGSRLVKGSKVKVGSKGKGKLKIRAKGKARKSLKKRGRAKVRLKLIYRPGGDCQPVSKSKQVTLIRKR